MKRYILSTIVLALIVLPHIATALIFIPTANIVIITNTAPSDGVFNYHLSQGLVGVSTWHTNTVNGTSTYTIPFLVAHPDSYTIYQEQQSGLSTSVFCSSSNNNSTFNVSGSQVTVTLYPDDLVTCTFTSAVESTQDKTLLIPGILGTEFFKGDTKLWPDTTKMLYTNNDRFMDPLSYAPSGGPIDFSAVTGDILGKPAITYDYSSRIINDLHQRGYVDNETLFTFPYDWRKDISDIALQDLKAKIDALVPAGSGKKIDVVAHSQGGLVIKYLLYSQPEYRSKIGKLIFVGTPHLGAPKATKALLYGDAMGVDLLGLGLDPQEIKRIGQNMPSVYELMPSEEFFNHVLVGYLGTTEKVGFLSGIEKINIYDYNTTKQVLKDKGLNATLIDSAQAFHDPALDNFDFSGTGIDTYNIVGCQDATMGRIFSRSNGKYRIEYVAGDGTVPIVSANNVGVGHTYYALETEHGTMLTGDGTREQIEAILAGNSSAVTNKITTNAADCHFTGEQVSVHSPVDLHIYDENGNHVGPTASGGFDYQIPHVQYDVLGEEKFAFLPPGHTYRLELPATSAGTFDLYTEKIETGSLTSSAYYHSVPIASTSKASVVLNSSNSQILQLDANGDGTTDSFLAPTSVLGPAELSDVLASVTKLVATGTQGLPGWYRSNVALAFSAIDYAQSGSDPAGVLDIKYSLDGGVVGVYTAPLTVASEGMHVVKFYATDRAGNSEALQEFTFTIDKTAPEAVLTFTVQAKDILATGYDALDSSPVVIDSGDRVYMADKAGNITVVGLSEKDRKKKLKAELVSLSYNGVLQDLAKNKFSYAWEFDKNAKLKKLEQQAKSKKDFNVTAGYNGSTTKVEGKDATGKIKQTYPALKLLQIKTNKGDLDWSLL